MRAVLWGREHTMLGDVAVQELDGSCAIAISKGRHDKRWYYEDPNEDAVGAVVGRRARLLVLADGHYGWPATEAAVEAVLARLGHDPPPADLSDAQLLDVFWDAHQAVVGVTAPPQAPAPDSRTTLVVGLTTGDRLQWGSFGDSAVFVTDGVRTVRLDAPRHRFVGYRQMPRKALPANVDRGRVPLGRDDWVVVASDGFTDFARAFPRWLLDEDSPAEVARGLVEAAFSGGAGDNVAVGVIAPRSAAHPGEQQ